MVDYVRRRRAGTLRRCGGLRLQAVPASDGTAWYAVVQDDLHNLGLFRDLAAATARFEAARLEGAARERAAPLRPANVLILDDYRRRRRR
jgi:hypothetical protein